ncbi:hypothetical protein Tco_1302425 [Tanacetum coccineum]
MLAPRSAKALQEKVLLKLHGIRKLPGSPSFGGTLFWIIAELSSLRKAAEICFIVSSSLLKLMRFSELSVDHPFATLWIMVDVAWKRSRRSPRLLVSKSVELSLEILD